MQIPSNMASPSSSLLILALLLLVMKCSSISYEKGKSYKYTYDTKVLFNEAFSKKATKPQQDVGLHITIEFDLSPIYQGPDAAQLIKLQITSAALTSLHRSGMEGQLVDLTKFPLYFEYTDGVVGRVFAVESDSVFCTNIKKGIASVFQVQTEAGERMELDVSGECKTTYHISGPTIVKQKLKCENLEIAGQHSNENEVFGISVGSRSTWTYQMENGVVHSVMGSNRHVAMLNIKSTLNAVVLAVQKLTLLSSGTGPEDEIISADDFETATAILKKASNYPFIDMLLPSGTELQQCKGDQCVKPSDVLTRVKDSLTADKLATVEAAQGFLDLLKAFRNSGKDAIARTLTSSDSYYIVPQLIDVAMAAQTPAAQKALMELLNFEETSNLVYPQRYLLAAAYTTHPGSYLLNDLLALMKKRLPSIQLREGVALALGAVVHTYCQDPQQCVDQVVVDFEKTVLEMFSSCKDEECQLLYLRCMGNAGLGRFLRTILKTVSTTDSSMVGFTAVQALRRIPTHYFVEEEVKSLLKVYHQTERKHDSSVRGLAAEVLLDKVSSVSVVRSLLLGAMRDQNQFELSTYLLKKIVDLAKYNPQLRQNLGRVLLDSKVNNYNVWGQKGKSSGFSSLLADTQDTNATYGLFMEMARSGVLKKSFMIVNLQGKEAIQKLLNFGIYASGLESLLGEEQDPEDAEEEATAGMGLTLLDVLLPPVEFFRGSGGLMSAVWNAPSEPVSALQTNFLLQDHSQKFHLANGLIVDFQVLGVTSIDLTGSVSISLWNRNSESVIRNSGSMVIEGAMRLDSAIGKAGAVFTADGEAYIDFLTDVDFYESPFKMCMQMKRPKLAFRHVLNKYEAAMKFDRKYKSKISRIAKMEGLSYFLSQKNSEECKALLANKS